MSVVEQKLGLEAHGTVRLAPRSEPRGQLAEILVFLFLIGPSTVLSLLLVQHPQSDTGFVLLATMVVFRNLGLVALILYFLWRNGEPFTRIGWRLDGAWREVLLGFALSVPFFLFNGWVGDLFVYAGLTPAPHAEAMLTPHGSAQFVLATVLTIVVAISEETIYRGYLLLRLSFVSRSIVFAVILSTLVFSMGHGYEGTAGIATVGVMGLVLALVYLWRGSLVAPMVMHFFQDFVVIVVAGLLTQTPAPVSQVTLPKYAAPVAQSTTGFEGHVAAPITRELPLVSAGEGAHFSMASNRPGRPSGRTAASRFRRNGRPYSSRLSSL